MNEQLKLQKRLEEARNQHRELDGQIEALPRTPLNEFKIRCLQKEKLRLRDHMAQLEQELYPDIIA